MREHSPTIVSQVCAPIRSRWLAVDPPIQALVVSRELIRVAILWHELWHEGLEEASRHFFTEKNPDAMIAALEPLHDMLEAVNNLIMLLPSMHADERARALRLLVRLLLLRYLGESCTKPEKLVVGGECIAIQANWTRPGTFTMAYVEFLCGASPIDICLSRYSKK